MGRSVSYPSEAVFVAYYARPFEDEDDDDGMFFDDRVEDFKAGLQYRLPSLRSALNEWKGDEDVVLAKNDLAEIGMSEYCGLVAVWACVNDSAMDRAQEGLAQAWIDKVEGRIRECGKAFGEPLVKMGSMSNGEGVYRRAQ